jgi:hypothetical protein
MIARIWHGTTELAKAQDYLELLNRTGIPDYRNTKGNLGAYVLRRFSLWESIDAIKTFAGEDYERARYYPEDKGFLLEFEPNVQHYEVF